MRAAQSPVQYNSTEPHRAAPSEGTCITPGAEGAHFIPGKDRDTFAKFREGLDVPAKPAQKLKG